MYNALWTLIGREIIWGTAIGYELSEDKKYNFHRARIKPRLRITNM